ncbi:hypothetical protein AB0J40_34060 [Amycolatopsis sp. NPDC049691]|uniref:hypothetical protein n=1 Tax=Amycolatopsis sp. NPDC049691 TaxID=3155155 RepID=UPI00342A5A60
MRDRREHRAPGVPPTPGSRPAAPRAEFLLHLQRTAGNTAAGIVVQRGWAKDNADGVAAQMTGEDWNRDGGPWWLLNGHNPEGIVAILRQLGAARAKLAAHPVDGTRYDKPRLDLAMAVAARKDASASEVTGMDALRNASAGRITYAECWTALLALSKGARTGLYKRMSKGELASLLKRVNEAPAPKQPALEAELSPLLGPPATDLKLEFVPDASTVVEGGLVQPMGELRVFVTGKLTKTVPARGGPPESKKDESNPGHTFNPTTAGTFTLGEGGAVVGDSWKYSQLANGTPVKDTGTDILFERDGKWISVTKLKTKLTRDRIMFETTRVLALRELADDRSKTAQVNTEIEQARAGGPYRPLPGTWILNDFGKEGFRLTGTKGDIIHTTPETDDASRVLEAGDLVMSHGCIHILAGDRKELVEEGILRGGVTITVQPYDPAKMPLWGKPPAKTP